MIMTVLEAHLPAGQAETLQHMFEEEVRHLPRQMVQNYLTRSTADTSLWQIVAIWRSRAALDEYRSSVEVPGGVRMFRAVGAEPTLTIFELVTVATNE
jgi:heme-degrading monooxygenase HmoA